MSEEEKNIQALKQRAKEMLKDDNTRQIGAEEIYTIICEWENALNLISNLQKELEKKDKVIDLMLEKLYDYGFKVESADFKYININCIEEHFYKKVEEENE